MNKNVTQIQKRKNVRRKLAITTKKLTATAKENEKVNRKLAIVKHKLALTTRENEDYRYKLEVAAETLHTKVKQQRKISSRLIESETNYRRLFETAQDGILILDSQTGQITDVNPFLINLLGYSKSEFLQKKLWEVGAFKNMKASRDVFKIIQKEGFVRYEDLPLETKDGRSIDVEFVSNSYMAGGALVVQCNIRDITERKRVDLIKETKRLFEDERMKVESIADATHELRTPLAIIKGNVDLALKKNIDGRHKSQKSALRAINYEIKHLAGILADLSLITSKAWELKSLIAFEKINLKSLVSTVVNRCRALSFNKKISITSSIIPNITILGDKVYLEKMLVNLVKNSILYGQDKGRTTIDAKVVKGAVTINVTDNGIGIPKDDLPHVFERFYRVDKFHRSGGNSIGLGLAIVKWITEIHGGSVSARSIKGKGSVFSVSLPIKSEK